MTALQRLRLPALLCCVMFLACVLVSHPVAETGICDDWSYILTARNLAATGHVVYNGWATALLGWQLYLAAAFIKLFGFSFTVVRMSTLLVAVFTTFFLHRTLARAGLSTRTATIGTLALVFSPLFMMLSVTFMTDIQGLFALVLCLYSCLRALQATTERSITAWICFAVFANALCGTARQIAWLGVLVMVPSTLWLLRSRLLRSRLLRSSVPPPRLPAIHKNVLFIGAAANIAGALFILAAMQWFKQQPYSIPEHILPRTFVPSKVIWAIVHLVLNVPLLLLPLAVLFLPQLRRYSRRTLALFAAFALIYLLAARHLWHIQPDPLIEPTMLDWVNVHGTFESTNLPGQPPLFLPVPLQIALTVLCVASLFCMAVSLLRARAAAAPLPASTAVSISTRQLTLLLGPFSLAYLLLLIPRANDMLIDRYLLPLLVVAAIVLLRLYQDYIHPRIPGAALVLIAVYAVYSVAVDHNMFSFYRARIAIAAEVYSSGVPDTALDGAWEHNAVVELRYAPNINDNRIVTPEHGYTPMPIRISGKCGIGDNFPHITPRYAVSFDPDACQGPTTFAPVHYSRWLASKPGTLYVVNDKLPPAQPVPQPIP